MVLNRRNRCCRCRCHCCRLEMAICKKNRSNHNRDEYDLGLTLRLVSKMMNNGCMRNVSTIQYTIHQYTKLYTPHYHSIALILERSLILQYNNLTCFTILASIALFLFPSSFLFLSASSSSSLSLIRSLWSTITSRQSRTNHVIMEKARRSKMAEMVHPVRKDMLSSMVVLVLVECTCIICDSVGGGDGDWSEWRVDTFIL